jgi:hypothetical protein
MTKPKNITAFSSITITGVNVSSSGFYKRNNAFPSLANSTAICTVFVLSAVNYQTVCNDLCLSSVQTHNCFHISHNTVDVRTSHLVARLLTANCNFGILYGSE